MQYAQPMCGESLTGAPNSAQREGISKESCAKNQRLDRVPRTLRIEGYKNFRDPFNMTFSKDLNVLVGENATGKTAIIDAIRLLLLEDEFGRNLVSDSDFHAPFLKPKEVAEFFQLNAVFNDLSDEQGVAFLPWLDESDRAILTLHVQNKTTPRGRFKWELWGGVSRSRHV